MTIEACRAGDLPRLLDNAHDAYQHARRMVYDQLAPGEKADPARLGEPQRRALIDLDEAERALEEYRAAAAR